MVVVDANVLIYAVNESSPQHESARRWLYEALTSDETVGLAWTVLLAFLRLATHPSVFPRPLSLSESSQVLDSWLASPMVIAIEPTPRHLALLRGLLAGAGATGNLVNEAHLAALALEHGASVVSFDRDFARFEGLSLIRPS
ncbi:MAG: type II toxin-antitoxin system VapC family toxin [Nocardioidaceae bacterium]